MFAPMKIIANVTYFHLTQIKDGNHGFFHNSVTQEASQISFSLKMIFSPIHIKALKSLMCKLIC